MSKTRNLKFLAVLGAAIGAAGLAAPAAAVASPQHSASSAQTDSRQVIKVEGSAKVGTTDVDASWYGCDSGNACLYTGTAGKEPSGKHTDYYYYGYHNLSNVLGSHWIINNQTKGAKVYPCTGYGGTHCHDFLFKWSDGKTTDYIRAGWGGKFDMTKVNSLRLSA